MKNIVLFCLSPKTLLFFLFLYGNKSDHDVEMKNFKMIFFLSFFQWTCFFSRLTCSAVILQMTTINRLPSKSKQALRM